MDEFSTKQKAVPANHGDDQQDTALQVEYHHYLVHLEAHQDPTLRDWTVTAYIEFTDENLIVHTIVSKLQDVFRSENKAKKFMLRQVQQWIDCRLFHATLKEAAVVQCTKSLRTMVSLVSKASTLNLTPSESRDLTDSHGSARPSKR